MSQANDFIPQFKEVFSKMHGDLPLDEYKKVKEYIFSELHKHDNYCRLINLGNKNGK